MFAYPDDADCVLSPVDTVSLQVVLDRHCVAHVRESQDLVVAGAKQVAVDGDPADVQQELPRFYNVTSQLSVTHQ